jgi:hypothetical protein
MSYHSLWSEVILGCVGRVICRAGPMTYWQELMVLMPSWFVWYTDLHSSHWSSMTIWLLQAVKFKFRAAGMTFLDSTTLVGEVESTTFLRFTTSRRFLCRSGEVRSLPDYSPSSRAHLHTFRIISVKYIFAFTLHDSSSFLDSVVSPYIRHFHSLTTQTGVMREHTDYFHFFMKSNLKLVSGSGVRYQH